MLVPLADAVPATCGGKAGALGALLRAGLPVPPGFVVPFDADTGLLDALGPELDALGDTPVAVRSSAAAEDTAQGSAAGQYESFLAVYGPAAVADAVRACRASLHSPRAAAYRDARKTGAEDVMAVLVQRHVDAEVAGVMFTPDRPGGTTAIEAAWGLGPSVVGGTVTPDAYRVAGDGTVARTVAGKQTRLDRRGTALVTGDVPAWQRDLPALDDAAARRLARLGQQVAAVLGGAQDIEWAIGADGVLWMLQARPVTAAPPPSGPAVAAAGLPAAALAGTPGSRGTATGTARIVRGPGDFGRVRPGDILVCPCTDPAWTPLLRLAAGVVTELGGVLSHAAIVAREHGIPAVLAVPDATTRLRDGALITVDGTGGTVTPADHP
ncbi:hypothetical protein Cs7R123_66480 [Catellatospora sp. TT07R-123]|uniref:PEP/pyruvate-binding domain-containing protein n=1 Tax=Catellatospora sp. TT07R-123 TaxID=2733863 RepID=UPI001B063FAC|nr:PEP/pyruvate-binding domain-containing protein [Catellatospora sp. TT07R-123]GHJ49306.1 hypothetical protein Cs7R123_66480 [Catellatospora sp. TT07R-123]